MKSQLVTDKATNIKTLDSGFGEPIYPLTMTIRVQNMVKMLLLFGIEYTLLFKPYHVNILAQIVHFGGLTYQNTRRTKSDTRVNFGHFKLFLWTQT